MTQSVDDRTDRGALRLEGATLRNVEIEASGGGVHGSLSRSGIRAPKATPSLTTATAAPRPLPSRARRRARRPASTTPARSVTPAARADACHSKLASDPVITSNGPRFSPSKRGQTCEMCDDVPDREQRGREVVQRVRGDHAGPETAHSPVAGGRQQPRQPNRDAARDDGQRSGEQHGAGGNAPPRDRPRDRRERDDDRQRGSPRREHRTCSPNTSRTRKQAIALPPIVSARRSTGSRAATPIGRRGNTSRYANHPTIDATIDGMSPCARKSELVSEKCDAARRFVRFEIGSAVLASIANSTGWKTSITGSRPTLRAVRAYSGVSSTTAASRFNRATTAAAMIQQVPTTRGVRAASDASSSNTPI